MARVLILREATMVRRTAELIEAAGHTPLILPLEVSEPTGEPVPPGPVSALAVTSRRAVPAVARAFANDPPPVFAVGARTAEALREAGFSSVIEAAGDADALAGSIAEVGPGRRATILYATGRPRTGRLEAELARLGIRTIVWEAYAMRMLEPDAATVGAALGGSAPDAVLVLSVGQAHAYATLAGRFPQWFDPAPRALVLSSRIRDALPPRMGRDALVSPDKTIDALFPARR